MTDMTRDQFIRAQRLLNVTREEMAEALDVDVGSIGSYRSGDRAVPVRIALKIANLLAMPEHERERHIFRNKMKYSR